MLNSICKYKNLPWMGRKSKFDSNFFGVAVAVLMIQLVAPSFVIAQSLDVAQSGSGTGNSSLTAGGTSSKISTGTSQSIGQTPLLIIKNNTGVGAVTQGWAVGTQNANIDVVVPVRDQGAGASVSIMQNPTGSNVKNNVSALTQPPTIVVSLPTCTGGQILVGNVCACTGALVWNGTNCVTGTLCSSILPANSNAVQTCVSFYGSAGWTGNVSTPTTWSCPSTYAVPVSAVGAPNTSGCVALPTCVSMKPANSSSTQLCSTYYGSVGWSGNVTTTTTWSCPTTYGVPLSAVGAPNTSGCTALPTCASVKPANSSTSQLCTTYYGSAGWSGNVTTPTTWSCPSTYGAPVSAIGAPNTSGCTALPTCASVKPANSSTSQLCTTYYGSPAWSGNVTTPKTWSCPTTYGAPVSATGAPNTSGCTPLAVSCTPGSYKNPPVACDPGYTGTKFTTTTISCPSGIYGPPSSITSGFDTSSCVLVPLPPPTPQCDAIVDWRGNNVSVYMTKKGKVLSGVITLACYGPAIQGTTGQKSTIQCGYIWNGGGPEWPEFPTGIPGTNPGFVMEDSFISVCVGASWSSRY